MCLRAVVGPGEEPPVAGRQGGGGAAKGPDPRPAGEEPAAREREPHPQSSDTQHLTLMSQDSANATWLPMGSGSRTGVDQTHLTPQS